MVAPLSTTFNAPLLALRQQTLAPDTFDAPLPIGLRLHVDPGAVMTGTRAAPRGRLLTLDTTVHNPGTWFALRLTLGTADFSGLAGVGFWLRSAAPKAMVSRACLRSGLADGSHIDCYYDRYILSQANQTDHHDLIMFDHQPTIPISAAWREFILFLPPTQDLECSLIDLRLFTIEAAP